ncbi:hypothetical protein [Methyloceanibacter sp.]|uniref:hypothetical protein n=1 Tax=Methyloceanibacter sp. TaxID=1965321 RepID=UPI0020877FEE|nr:hypothetical protein [Methyloceanibacter sp.]GFO81332.1 MAG: hypothetical protein A49_09590 [Methyloceanibacter sp.]HML91182.1 hypothetical protein [Methyloceanibacter sp.]
MRAVAGPNRAQYSSRESLQSEIDRHSEALSRFAELALQGGLEAPVCTLVLRSAESLPAIALANMRDILAAAGIRARAVLTKANPEQQLHSFFGTLAALSPDTELGELVRWARHPRLMDAHEQAVYGPELCWTGDAIRRDADKRNALALFETGPDAIIRGSHAFKALWAASDPLPGHLLDARASAGRPCADNRAKDAPPAAMTPPTEGWPLLRH